VSLSNTDWTNLASVFPLSVLREIPHGEEFSSEATGGMAIEVAT
jgi:hypothetical protein